MVLVEKFFTLIMGGTVSFHTLVKTDTEVYSNVLLSHENDEKCNPFVFKTMVSATPGFSIITVINKGSILINLHTCTLTFS